MTEILKTVSYKINPRKLKEDMTSFGQDFTVNVDGFKASSSGILEPDDNAPSPGTMIIKFDPDLTEDQISSVHILIDNHNYLTQSAEEIRLDKDARDLDSLRNFYKTKGNWTLNEQTVMLEIVSRCILRLIAFEKI